MADFLSIKIPQRSIDAIAEKLGEAKNAFTQSEAQALGDEIVSDMKDLISKGISPIKGEGRFEGYKNPENYPKSVRKRYPNKRTRPVNLWLSGDFLKSLKARTYKAKAGYGIQVGYTDDISRQKEESHAAGAGGQPKRPTIPSDGQEFSSSIQRKIVTRFREAILDFLRKR